MDFFAAQDHARRQSRLLVLWFALAVVLIIVVVHAGAALLLFPAEDGSVATAPLFDPAQFLATAAVVGGVILLASLYRIARLAAGGGEAVARALGGRPLARATPDPLERRLLNIVDEMAVASGLPAPPVYVLDAEPGINAFAAGARPQQAVVALTRGALEKLDRDQLQGVVAHEFSHILNGDMRLNLRLIGLLHGILVLSLIGRVLLRGGGRGGKSRSPFALLGLLLVAVGHIGVLCGQLIKAAVSRQREFLADAAAVQFTRNPAGLAGALRRIAGHDANIGHPRAEEVSHMLFGASARLSALFATHPPLAERIRRIDPRFLPDHPLPATPPASTTAAASAPTAETAAAFTATIGQPQPAHLAQAQIRIARLDEALRQSLHEPSGAQAICLALLLDRDPGIRQRQRQKIAAALGDPLASRTELEYSTVATLDPGMRLPLIELALGPLRELDRAGRERFIALLDALADTDGWLALGEYVLVRLLRDALQPRAPAPSLAASPAELRRHTALLLSVIAIAGQHDAAGTRAAYARGAAAAPLDALGPLLEAGEISFPALDRAFTRLAATAPPFRRRLVQAMAEAAIEDGQLAPIEAELLRAACEALDCPAPLRLD
ncbi:M48 family metallopeptidase [Thauera chlorobenzoica]|uniref:Putative protease n=1 Tax=Thauera chlorobenzoica TaxID=96773 RepID=A0A1H5RMM1_9RHOO|nr:M48 family metallopeptidase [Thauera chlorobenzoica]APR05252.1 putative protease [Thauera chlorobenzoica]SEF39575.1 Zn-dependent protease with chaperone function [Thauera chlorobenzoica]